MGKGSRGYISNSILIDHRVIYTLKNLKFLPVMRSLIPLIRSVYGAKYIDNLYKVIIINHTRSFQ